MDELRKHHRVTFLSEDRPPACPPNPAYPNGIHIDATGGAPGCWVALPYPANCVGAYVVVCEICKTTAAITVAGRPDDPRRVKIACKFVGRA